MTKILLARGREMPLPLLISLAALDNARAPALGRFAKMRWPRELDRLEETVRTLDTQLDLDLVSNAVRLYQLDAKGRSSRAERIAARREMRRIKEIYHQRRQDPTSPLYDRRVQGPFREPHSVHAGNTGNKLRPYNERLDRIAAFFSDEDRRRLAAMEAHLLDLKDRVATMKRDDALPDRLRREADAVRRGRRSADAEIQALMIAGDPLPNRHFFPSSATAEERAQKRARSDALAVARRELRDALHPEDILEDASVQTVPLFFMAYTMEILGARIVRALRTVTARWRASPAGRRTLARWEFLRSDWERRLFRERHDQRDARRVVQLLELGWEGSLTTPATVTDRTPAIARYAAPVLRGLAAALNDPKRIDPLVRALREERSRRLLPATLPGWTVLLFLGRAAFGAPALLTGNAEETPIHQLFVNDDHPETRRQVRAVAEAFARLNRDAPHPGVLLLTAGSPAIHRAQLDDLAAGLSHVHPLAPVRVNERLSFDELADASEALVNGLLGRGTRLSWRVVNAPIGGVEGLHADAASESPLRAALRRALVEALTHTALFTLANFDALLQVAQFLSTNA
jgi:hypothetical protein